ncbi:STAS domain-containing protein [Actinomadura verrucosospora]|uniref:Anti-sigma factor (Antagonist of SpoIIAB) n=1 Tax=Actinomadura verrucosospora TaxID=46165 RepID=A0A7D3ZLZ8_ACTVE|nr:STAS domain-containing protein [Actinomadura verrucosospora]QKG23521.1 anti-sigma factor (Antagonist of SpoIIAB) [Actinomadura verrucosospora]
MAECTVTGGVRDGRTVIALAGHLTLDTVQHTEQRMRTLRREHGEHVVLDLSGLRFLDSAGLSLLLRFYLAAEGRGGSAVLAGPLSDEVLYLLRTTHVDRRLPVHPTLGDALAVPPPADGGVARAPR